MVPFWVDTMSTRILTGITTTGTPHLGNYVGAIRPAIEQSRDLNNQSFFFLADYHALIKCDDPDRVHQSTLEIAATWLAFGLDVENVVFYRQSDIPEIPELCWFLMCNTAKGVMNRAHAYKARVQDNVEAQTDPDHAVTMGLYTYPVLMAADILLFNANKVPVGRDQEQHVEMARVIASRVNHHYNTDLALPESVVDDDTAILNGLDGRKMSKSYNNTIPLFDTAKKLKKSINKIKTNLLEPGEPKDPDTSTVFQVWQAFATAEQTVSMREAFTQGIAWGEAKKQLFELLDEQLQGPRAEYALLMAEPGYIESVLQKGAVRAREHAKPAMASIRQAMGIYGLNK
ncbi:tryptophan--tRNA ligase [bacterium]|nr:tryptophan--tRNA ligase [bacterium]